MVTHYPSLAREHTRAITMLDGVVAA